MKPFPKTERKVVTIMIDESGDLVYLRTPESDIFLELGETITRRASHVEPGPRYERWAFRLLRTIFGDSGKVSDWTRSWNTLWRVDTSPVGGPILRWGHVMPNCPACMADDIYYECDRKRAIQAEVKFLNTFFLEGK